MSHIVQSNVVVLRQSESILSQELIIKMIDWLFWDAYCIYISLVTAAAFIYIFTFYRGQLRTTKNVTAPSRPMSISRSGGRGSRGYRHRRPQGGGQVGHLHPGFWVKMYLGEHFFQQLPAAVTTAVSCNQKGLLKRPCSSKFRNFLALAREPYRKKFVWQARPKTGRNCSFSYLSHW